MSIKESKKFGQKLVVLHDAAELAYVAGSFPPYQLECKRVGFTRVNGSAYHVGVIYDEDDVVEIGDIESLAKESGLKVILNEKFKS